MLAGALYGGQEGSARFLGRFMLSLGENLDVRRGFDGRHWQTPETLVECIHHRASVNKEGQLLVAYALN